jgi:single-strand DNA-binding protein
MDGESASYSAPAPRRQAAPAPAASRAAAGGNGAARPAGTTAGNEDFEDFPGALEDEDDDLPF